MQYTKNLVFFDLETQNLSDDVGGWNNKHLFKISIGVTFNTKNNDYNSYTEEKTDNLIEELSKADLIIGFNIKNFDFHVLQPYTTTVLHKLPTFDILETVYKELGFRLSLENLATTTLSIGKSSDGIQAVKWFRNGEIDKIIEYCKNDVKVTKDLFEFGINNGYLFYTNRQGIKTKVSFKFPFEL
jgi:DEAD/DEAH box helicase domain-containing protein